MNNSREDENTSDSNHNQQPQPQLKSELQDSFSEVPFESRLHKYINQKQLPKTAKVKQVLLFPQLGQLIKQLEFLNYFQSLQEIDENIINQEKLRNSNAGYVGQKKIVKKQKPLMEFRASAKNIIQEEDCEKENVQKYVLIV